MRISPPVPTNLRRELPPTDIEPLTTDGYNIPPGNRAAVNVYVAHHNEAYFLEPFVFNPERLLPSDNDLEDAKSAKKIMYEAFNPSSIRPRGCAGKAMAYVEASLVAAKTL